MSLWLALLAGGLLTFAMRFSFIYLAGRMQFPESLKRALKYVPPTVFSAIIVPELLMHSGRIDVGLGNTRLLAGLAAIVVAWKSRSILISLLAGFGVLLALGLLF